MKKTITIALQGVPFTIEEDAYQKLDTYTASVRAHLSQTSDRDEIVADIEARIAELLLERTSDGKRVVGLVDVEEVVREMGSAEELGAAGGGQSAFGARREPARKLYRRADDKIIAGVASGIAAYFNIDPVIVRLAFVLVALLNGLGVVIYIILWLITPEAKTLREKREMKGDAAAFEKVVEDVKKNFEEGGISAVSNTPASGVRGVVRAFFGAILGFIRTVFCLVGVFLRTILPAIIRVVGGVIAFAAIVATLALTFLCAMFFWNVDSPYVDFPVRGFLSPFELYVGIVSGYAVLIVPILLIVLLGMSLIRWKNRFTSGSVGALIAFFFVGLLGLGFVASSAGPAYYEHVINAPKVTESYVPEPFHSVRVEAPDRVTIEEGDEYALIYTGLVNDVMRRHYEVRDGELVLSRDSNDRICIACIHQPVEVTVTLPSGTFRALEMSHASRAWLTAISTSTISLNITHASRVEAAINAPATEVLVSNASSAYLKGTTAALSGTVEHASRLNTEELSVSSATLDIRNASDVHLGVLDEIKATILHASSLKYEGDPKTDFDTDLSSSVRRIE